jgi:hypothetical protein
MRASVSSPGVQSLFHFLFVLAGLVCLVGCDSGPTLVPVKGVVMLNDKPLTSGTVIYHPDKGKGNKFGGLSIGEINDKGEYTLLTNGKPGAPVGDCKVTVTSTGSATVPDNTKPTTKSPVNQTYATVELTPLAVQVVEKGAPGAYDLKVGP